MHADGSVVLLPCVSRASDLLLAHAAVSSVAEMCAASGFAVPSGPRPTARASGARARGGSFSGEALPFAVPYGYALGAEWLRATGLAAMVSISLALLETVTRIVTEKMLRHDSGSVSNPEALFSGLSSDRWWRFDNFIQW